MKNYIMKIKNCIAGRFGETDKRFGKLVCYVM